MRKLRPALNESWKWNQMHLSLFGVQVKNCSVDQCVDVLASLPHLSKLSIPGFVMLSDEFILSLLSRIGTQLCNLDLGGNMHKFSDRAIQAISDYCTEGLDSLGMDIIREVSFRPLLPWLKQKKVSQRLKSLRFARCTDMDMEVLWKIADNCCGLQDLNLSGMFKTELNDDYISRLSETCGKTLEYISVRGNREVTDNGIVDLARNCPNLVTIDLSGLAKVSDTSILVMANHCHYLTEICVRGCPLISRASINYLQDQCIGRLSAYNSINNTDEVLVAKNLDAGVYEQLFY